MQLFLILLSSILWGTTNPFIRKASAGIEKVKARNNFEKIFLELKFLFTNFNVSYYPYVLFLTQRYFKQNPF
jgi:hypothetical protein